MDPLRQQRADVDGRRAAAEQADLDDRAARSDGGEVAIDLLAADDVEHDVDAVGAARRERLAQRSEPVGGRALEDDVGAELACSGAPCPPNT